MSAARAALAAEYRLNWLHECFSKPTVAFIDGIAMGSGVGLSAYCTHRVAGPRYRWAMPETAIGFFPDVGVAHLLARMPHRIGVYLALTGHSVERADALALGLVTHCMDEAAFDVVAAGLVDAQPVDVLLDAAHRDPGTPVLMAQAETIARCFVPDTVEAILARLSEVRGAGEVFAQRALADLKARSPLALKASLRHVRDAAALDLRQTLEADYRLACRFLQAHDFHEGVRAALVDKDQKPRWLPTALADVTGQMVDDLFAPMPGAELNLSLRQEMQAARV